MKNICIKLAFWTFVVDGPRMKHMKCIERPNVPFLQNLAHILIGLFPT